MTTPNKPKSGLTMSELRNTSGYDFARQEEALLEAQALATAGQNNGSEPPEPYDDAALPVEITPQEEYIGMKTYTYFMSTLKRISPWFIGADRLELLKPSPSRLKAHPDSFIQAPNLKYPRINLERLAKERISEDMARVIFGFKIVEDKLADYMGRATSLFRNYHGISRSYNQWGLEEGQHSDALGMVLIFTADMKPVGLEEQYYENLLRTWELPFKGPRKMVIYAALQELFTHVAYEALEQSALREDAPTVSEIMHLISKDEAYHGGGYRKFAELFAEIDPEGTRADTLHVAKHFLMPAQRLVPEVGRYFVSSRRVMGLSKQLVADAAIYEGVRRFGYMTEELARQAADEYLNSDNK
jgi:Fatty acid desaturase